MSAQRAPCDIKGCTTLKIARSKSTALAALAGALALTLSACQSRPQGDGANGGQTTDSSSSQNSGSGLSGTLNGSGASSQANAQQAWRDNFRNIESGITVNYEATGSGTGAVSSSSEARLPLPHRTRSFPQTSAPRRRSAAVRLSNCRLYLPDCCGLQPSRCGQAEPHR